MRLEGWSIDAFGRFQRQEVRGLTSGLTVVAGPNEAGKSTLLAFLRGVLFGFPDRRSRQPQYSPPDGGPAGGRVFLEGPEGTCTVERWVGRRGSLRVSLAGGQEIPAAELSRWFGGADETLFRSVFAFSLAELQTIESLQVDEVRDRIYSAHVTGAGQSARSAMRRLEEETAALLRPRGASRIGELALRVAQLEEICRDARAHAAEYAALVDSERALRAEVDAFGEQLERAQGSVRWYGSLRELWPLWQERVQAQEQPEALPAEDPRGGLREARAAAEAARAGLDAEIDRLSAEAARLDEPEDAGLLSRGAQVDQLAARLPLYEEQLRQCGELRQKAAALSEQIARVLERLGPEWSEERVASFDPPPDWIDQARAWAASLASGWKDIQERRANWERASAERERLEQALEAEPPAEPGPDRERLLELRSKAAELEAEERALEVLRATTADADEVPGPPRWSMGLIVVAVFALVGVGGWLSTTSALAGGTVILLALMALVAFFVKASAGQRAASSGTSSAWAAAEQRIAALKTELAEEGGGAGLGVTFTAADVEARVREALDREQGPLRRQLLEATLADAREHEQGQKVAYEAAAASFAEDTQGWVTWRQASELPESLTPENASALLADLQLGHSLIRARIEAQERAVELHREIDAWEQPLREWEGPAAAGWPAGQTGRPILAGWQQRVESARQRRSRRGELQRQAGERETRLAAAREEIARLDQALRQQEAAPGVNAMRAFEQRQADLLVRLSGFADRAALESALSEGDADDWERHERSSAESVETLRRQRDETIGRLRLAEQRRQFLEQSDEVAVCESQLAFARAELERATRQWLVASLAHGLIEETLADYTRTRQPEVLREASVSFSRITGGGYLRVAQDENGPNLIVEDSRGRWWRPEQLSRGTAEQLFLALRFGLATEFARHSASLPVVMDDVLVNFDPDRAEATAREIARFARSAEPERQVLFFTCHPETARLLREACPEARCLELAPQATFAAG